LRAGVTILGAGVVGCGLIGSRRAAEAARHPASRCVAVADTDIGRAERVAAEAGARVARDWHELIASPDIDVVCVATPNGRLAQIAIAALNAGKHVLLEKPMGRSLDEARAIRAAARAAGRRVKVGFNHRYHPAIARAHGELANGTIGTPINARARYGHGARPGYEREWRGNAELAGGGELTDQGVHVVDLLHWFLGPPRDVYAVTQRAVWPLGELEDNAFAVLRYAGGAVASFHTSWTQWRNLFSFEIFGTAGSLVVEGLGGSYGEESLTIALRAPEGGAPLTERLAFAGPDTSWRDEWDDFITGIGAGRAFLGDADDGVVAMATLAALYASARSGLPEPYGSRRSGDP
jgi:predicted dehydrogenase